MEKAAVPRKAQSSHEPAVPPAPRSAIDIVVDHPLDLVEVVRLDDVLAGVGQLVETVIVVACRRREQRFDPGRGVGGRRPGDAGPARCDPRCASRWPSRADPWAARRPGIAGKETVLRVHLIPAFGAKRLDAISSEDVARLKARLVAKAPKTVNNVLTVLNVLLKTAVEWHVIDQVPCSVRLVRVPRSESTFHDFADYERLVSAAQALGEATQLIVLLGAEAGLRCGEIMALEWSDVDVTRHRLSVARSEWKGQVTATKGGRPRHVPLTGRLEAALRQARHLRGQRVVCDTQGDSFTQKRVRTAVVWAMRRAGLKRGGVHTLRHTFCSHLAMKGGSRQGHPGAGGAPGSVHDAALHASESRDAGCGDPAARWRRIVCEPWRNSGGGGN